MHIFFKLPRPVDRPIESNFAVLPSLYRTPAGPYGGVYDSQNPKGESYFSCLLARSNEILIFDGILRVLDAALSPFGCVRPLYATYRRRMVQMRVLRQRSL